MPESAIVDTSVLIALQRINLLDLLCNIFDRNGESIIKHIKEEGIRVM